jgi:hypothetical protein
VCDAMVREWTHDELVEHWTLAPSELLLLMNKSGLSRIGFATLLKFFQPTLAFPLPKLMCPPQRRLFCFTALTMRPSGAHAKGSC